MGKTWMADMGQIANKFFNIPQVEDEYELDDDFSWLLAESILRGIRPLLIFLEVFRIIYIPFRHF